MTVSNELSKEINSFRTLLILGVIFIHNPLYSVATGSEGVPEYWFRMLSPISFVPGFFVLSGFFLFNRFDGSWAGYLSIVKKRIFSLLLPYVSWNLLIFLCYWALPHITHSAILAQARSLEIHSGWDALNQILGITGSPICFQFWFIRNLFCYVLLLPLLFFCYERFRFATVLLLGSLAMLNVHQVFCEIFYLICGALLNSYGEEKYLSWKNRSFLVLLLAFPVISMIRMQGNAQFGTLSGLLGIVFWFFILQNLIRLPLAKRVLSLLSPAVFFIFGGHGILIVLLRKLWLRFVPTGSVTLLLGYFLLPVLCIGISFIAFLALKTIAARPLSLLCGGRINR